MTTAQTDSRRQRLFKESKRKSPEEQFPEIVDFYFKQLYK